MKKRPVCMLCLLFLFFMILVDTFFFPLIRGNPLPEDLQRWIAAHPQATVSGRVEKVTESDSGLSVYLRDACIYDKEKGGHYSIRNLRAFLLDEGCSPGELVLLSGTLERVPEVRNPGEFDSRQYYAASHIYYFLKKASIQKQLTPEASISEWLARIRQKCLQTLETAAGEDAGIYDAMLLGDKTALDQDLKLLYQLSGIIHILAISGLHISILGTGFFSLLKKAGAGLVVSSLIALAAMVFFGALTGAGISTLRAVCMFLLAEGASISGRSYDLPTALSVAAVLTVLEAPARLYTASFLLSFGAVLGISLLMPVLLLPFPNLLSVPKQALFLTYDKPIPDCIHDSHGHDRQIAEKLHVHDIHDRLNHGKRIRVEPSVIKQKLIQTCISSLAGSASVMLMTLPVSLWFYGESSLAGLFLNLLIIPTAGLVLASGIAAVIVGSMLPASAAGAAGVFLIPGRLLLALYRKLCLIAVRIPGCIWIGGKPSLWQVAVYECILLFIVWYMKRAFPEKKSSRNTSTKSSSKRKTVVIFSSVFLLLAGIQILGSHPVRDLRITCLDVGQGDGIVLQNRSGRAWLIDGGSSSRKNVGTCQILPYLKSQGISRLEGILISHTDDDHISGVLELLDLRARHLSSISIGTLYLPSWIEKPSQWEELAEKAKCCGAQVREVKRGDEIRCGEVTFKALAPDPGATVSDINEDCMVLMVAYKGFSALFTGDIGEETEHRLLPVLTDVDFLKVGHHGSRFSSSEEFLEKIRPEVGVISCSLTNRYGHPSPESVARLEQIGCRLFYTMKNGAIVLKTDGKQMQIRKTCSG